MAERFSRLYTLPTNLYVDDAPVIIAAGALLKDNQTGNRLAQLKIQNIDKRTIVSIKLHFVLLDASEKMIGEHDHVFSGISVTEQDYYGPKTPVVFPVDGVCSFNVSIVEVTFNNGPEWRSNADWNTLDANTDIGVLKNERDLRIQEMLAMEARERAIAEELRMKEEAEAKAAKEREEAERIAIENQQKAVRRKKILKIAPIVAVVIVILTVVIANAIQTNREQDRLRREELAVRDTISAGGNSIVGLKTDGTIVVDGEYYYGVDGWTDIIAVSAGGGHIVGLKADGTVVAAGNNKDGQCNVGSWTDIIAISAGWKHTVGLKADGTVVAVGSNYGGWGSDGPCDVSEWKNIIAIHADMCYTVGLTSGGSVKIVGDQSDSKGLCVNWREIVAVSGGTEHIVGLKDDGTVVAVGNNKQFGQCDVSGWSDIIAIRAGSYSTIGLKADGTVVVVGSEGDRRAEEWTDIVAINAGDHVIGLRADGTVVAVGCHLNNIKYCDICREEDWKVWTNISIP